MSNEFKKAVVYEDINEGKSSLGQYLKNNFLQKINGTQRDFPEEPFDVCVFFFVHQRKCFN
jgi:hypothetical protein